MDLPTIENLANPILRIHCWLMHKDYRGQGLSHSLLQGILHWARSHNRKVVRASAGPDNYWVASRACAPMLRTYIKHGFQRIRTVPSSGLREMLMNFQQGKLGIKAKQEFERFCQGEDLTKLAVYHEVERRLS